MGLKNIFCFILYFTVIFPVLSQLQVIPLTSDPQRTINQDNNNARVNPDLYETTFLPFFDDFSSSKVNPDVSKWLPNEGTFINNTFPVNPLTKNVASFDGLNSVGVPYSTSNSAKGVTDKLTSIYIDLSASASNCSIPTLVFLYQCGGNGEPPDALESDSLVLQFMDNRGNWIFQWGSLAVTKNDTFYMAKVPVSDPSFYHNKFQFRFYTKGSQSGAYDVWNLDYVSLNRQTRQDLKSIYFTDDLNGWAVGTCGTILKTIDGGLTWNSNSIDTTVNMNSLIFTDANKAVAVADEGKIVLRKDNGSGSYQWEVNSTSITDNLRSVSFSSQNISNGWIAGDNGKILKTTNGGDTWVVQTTPETKNLASISSKNDSEVIAVGDLATVYYSNDGGASWLKQDSSSIGVGYANLNYVGYSNGSSFYVAGDNGIVLNASIPGIAWKKLSSNSQSNLNALKFVGLDTVWALGQNGAATFSVNRGVKWTSIRPISKWNVNSVYSNTLKKMWLCGDNNLIARYDKVKNSWLANSASIYTYFKDRAFTSEPKSFLKRYNAIPIRQFIANKDAEINDTLTASIFNLDATFTVTKIFGDLQYITNDLDQTSNSFNFLTISNPDLFFNPQTRFPLAGYPNKSNLNLDPNKAYKINTKYKLSAGDPAIYQGSDSIIKTNDISNYYAYDDGSAEFSIVTNQQFGRTALKYVLNTPDTLMAIDIYFTQVNKSLRFVNFNLFVWKALSNATNGPSLYNNVGASSTVFYGDSLNRFHRYYLKTLTGRDTNIVVSDSIYIGVRQLTTDNLTFGFDRNSDASKNMYYETTGRWEKYVDQYDYVPGSIMIRPVFLKTGLVITDVKDEIINEKTKFNIYPNPASNLISILPKPSQLEIYDLSGRLIIEKSQIDNSDISVDFLQNGLYLIRLKDVGGNSSTHRLIIQK